jgi:hypothetical protein
MFNSKILPDVKNGVKQLARVSNSSRTILQSSLNSQPTVLYDIDIWSLCQVNGNINAEKYISVLDSQLWSVIARHFPDDSYVFQDDNVLSIGLNTWSFSYLFSRKMVDVKIELSRFGYFELRKK